ncbi:MAG: HaeIII family restriction endonuclease [Bacteroidales bacterium]|nr:HaeIII family restriction endonuclease [Bacteroidales bacterium]
MHSRSITINKDFDFAKLWFAKTCSFEYTAENILLISKHISSNNSKDTIYHLLNNLKTEFLKFKPNQESLKKILQFIVEKDNSSLASVIWEEKKHRGIKLPTKIIDLSFKEKSTTTLILTMDNGWAISFRIYQTNSNIEPIFNLETQLFGRPSAILYLDAEW